jgi:hypothetical protein
MPLVDQRLIEKGRNGATPAAKMRNHFGKSPARKPYLLRFLDLRWIRFCWPTQFPSHSDAQYIVERKSEIL